MSARNRLNEKHDQLTKTLLLLWEMNMCRKIHSRALIRYIAVIFEAIAKIQRSIGKNQGRFFLPRGLMAYEGPAKLIHEKFPTIRQLRYGKWAFDY